MSGFQFEGLELEFGNTPNQYQTLFGTKVFYVDGEGNKIELCGVTHVGIPQSTGDDILSATITVPLLNIKFKGESQ